MAGDGWFGRGGRRLMYNKDVDQLIAEARAKEGLKKNLTARDLVTLGVAGIIGAGIFVLVGLGADAAGVGVVFAFMVAAFICVFAGFAYAELSAAIPASGSAYAYLYTAMGEFPGWMVAWALILEYAVGAIAVAVGWRNNFVALYNQYKGDFGWGDLNVDLVNSPLEPVAGIVNLPSIAIVAFCTLLLAIGTKESARFTAILVAIKVSILLMAIGVAGYLTFESGFVNLQGDWFPEDADGFLGMVGAITSAAALMFFAYIGFDSVSTTAEETKNPKRDLPIGILGSLAITTVLYILAALALVGAAPWQTFHGTSPEAAAAQGEPFGYVFEEEGIGWAATLVRIGAIVGTTSVLLVLILGGVRVFFNMSRDGLLPGWMSRVSASRGNPLLTTLLYGGMTMAFAGFVDLRKATELVNIGTLFAFAMVLLAVWVFRLRRPDVERPIRMPMWSVVNVQGKPYLPLFPIIGILAIGYLIARLDTFTLVAAVTWAGLGMVTYGLYGIRHSREARDRAARAGTAPAAAASAARQGARPAQAAPAANGAAAHGPYRHGDYTLYVRDVSLRNGGTRPVYFFAKGTPSSGRPSELPSGFRVGVNDRTGLPYLARE